MTLVRGGETIVAYCHTYLCNHKGTLDLLTLRDRFGPDHGAMHADLVPKLRCTKCGGRKVRIVCTPGTKEYGGSPYRKARGG